MGKTEITYLRNLRRKLHKDPQLSGEERQTADTIISELKDTQPDNIYKNVGGEGIVAIYGTSTEGAQIMFRCELDALPIHDEGDHQYRSETQGVSHACGHDGHMAVMIGVSRYLRDNRPPVGRVILLFQPSEETGEGAARMMNDPVFNEITPARSYAFHNLPGYEQGTLYLREGTFASASVGLSINLQGVSSHAAYPGQGKNPAKIIGPLIEAILNLNMGSFDQADYSVTTITYIHLGEKAFGVSPGTAEVGVTLRAGTDDRIDDLKLKIRDELEQLTGILSISYDIKENEPFKATINSGSCVNTMRRAAEKAGLPVKNLEHPFPWSEDFGRFGDVSDVGLAGIGIGIDRPHLHAEQYDFNDEVIPAAVNLFINIIHEEWNIALS